MAEIELTKILSLQGLGYYDTKIKAYIASAVEGQLSFELVDKLEDVSEPKKNIIYLVPNTIVGVDSDSDSDLYDITNIKDEYMWINDKWELIGTTTIDLTNYYTVDEADAKFATISDVNSISSRVSTAEGTISAHDTAIANVYTKTEVDEKISEISTGGSSGDIEEVAKVTAEAFADLKETIGTDEEFQVSFEGTNYLENIEDSDSEDSVVSIVDALFVLDDEIHTLSENKANKEDVYDKKTLNAMIITDAEIDNLFK
jgi:hypothetical protein